MEKCFSKDQSEATLIRGSGEFIESAKAEGIYTITCYDKNGIVKWEDKFENTVVTQGKNYLLTLLTSASSTNILRMGLKGTGTVSASDTYTSHAGWAEITAYSGSRGTPAWSASSAGSVSTSSAVSFSITGTATVTGCFMAMAPTATTLGTIGDTTATGAVLYSAGDFSSSKSVSSGDTLNVSYTASL